MTGEYVATEGTGVFTSETDDETTDLLEEGATINLVLEDGGAMSGTLLVPGWGEDGADLEAELDGTWELASFTVTVEVDAGTFLDGLELEWSEGLLSGSGTLDDETTFEIEVERDMS